MRRPIFMHQRQPTGGVRPNATQNGQTDPRTPCRSLLCRKSPLSRVGTSRQPANRYNLPHFRVHPRNPGLYVFQSLGSSRCPLGRAVPTYLRIYGWHGRRSTRPDWRDQIDAGRPRPSSVGHSHETETPMTPAMTLVLAFSMSLDAFAAALSKGAALKRRRLFDALRTGIIFGVIEAITPAV